MANPATTLSRHGLAAGVGAYILWGFLPLFFPLLEPAGPLTISAHRVVWSWVVCLVLLTATRRMNQLGRLLRDRNKMPRLALGSVFLSLNWLVFLIAVLTGRLVEASLGYFINPIVTVLLAVVVLKERINTAQWIALGIAASGLVVIGIEAGTVPWISFGLAFSFGLYGLVKKQISSNVPALAGLAAETTVLLPIAGIYLIVIALLGTGTFGVSTGPFGTQADHVLLLMFSGVATAVPLLLFNTATRRLPLATIGMLQFIVPIMQFSTGVYILGEYMSTGRWIGFFGVWVALIVLSADALQTARKRPRAHPNTS